MTPATRLAPDSRIPSTAVLALGNLLRSDDGLGIHAMRALQESHLLPCNIQLVDGGTLGLELACYLDSASRILLLDAIDNGLEPGSLIELSGDELTGLPGGISAHALGLADLLLTLRLVARQPQELVLLGLQPLSTDWGLELTPPLQANFPALIHRVLAQIEAWRSPPKVERSQ